MKITKEQATKIPDDFRHFDGRKIAISDGQIGEYPVVIVLPFDDNLSKECRMDIYNRMRDKTQLIRVYDLGDIPYTVQVFFQDLIPKDILGKYTDLEKWLKVIGMNFNKSKYGIE